MAKIKWAHALSRNGHASQRGIKTCLTDEKFLPAEFGLADDPLRLVVDRNPESVIADPEIKSWKVLKHIFLKTKKSYFFLSACKVLIHSLSTSQIKLINIFYSGHSNMFYIDFKLYPFSVTKQWFNNPISSGGIGIQTHDFQHKIEHVPLSPSNSILLSNSEDDLIQMNDVQCSGIRTYNLLVLILLPLPLDFITFWFGPFGHLYFFSFLKLHSI